MSKEGHINTIVIITIIVVISALVGIAYYLGGKHSTDKINKEIQQKEAKIIELTDNEVKLTGKETEAWKKVAIKNAEIKKKDKEIEMLKQQIQQKEQEITNVKAPESPDELVKRMDKQGYCITIRKKE